MKWISPFGHLRIEACLPAPRSLSQATTSFLASYCQGIHRMHLFTWPYNLSQHIKKSRTVICAGDAIYHFTNSKLLKSGVPLYKRHNIIQEVLALYSILYPLFLIVELVGPGRLELPTSPLSGVRSNQLSYGPACQKPLSDVVEPGGIEPPTLCLQSRRSPSWAMAPRCRG